MDPGQIFWLFFMLAALQPAMSQKFLEASRKHLIGQIERDRRSRVVLLVHRQETMSVLGFPVVRYIDVNDSEEVLRAIHLTDSDVPLDLVLHTPGGLVLATTQIARAVLRHKSKVTVFVPHYAMSGGTLIALAADEIVMCEHAVLGPVDPQLGERPAASILKAVRQKPIAEVDDEKELAKLLASGTWTHDYPITYERANALGLRVQKEMPESVLHLMQLYPQPTRRQSSVEYLPFPYRSGRSRESSPSRRQP